MEQREIAIDRVEPFYVPMFIHPDAITDDQCDQIIHFCEKLDYKSANPGFMNSMELSIDHDIMSSMPELKEYLEDVIGNISSFIMKQVHEGFEIRSSWATRGRMGEGVNVHSHKNYYMAGVLYLQDDSEIIVENPLTIFNNYVFELTEKTPYTCGSSTIVAPKNSFLLMPAYINHQVPSWTKDDTIRYSIAMNIHPVGTYGLDTSLMTV